MSTWLLIGSGWAAMTVVMALIWAVQRRRGDAGIVDLAWSLGVGLLAALFAALTGGYGPRRLLVAVMACIWASRLARHLLHRLLTLPEDGRYQALRRKWGERTQTYLFIFFQVQAFWSVLFALPMLLAAGNPAPALGAADFAGVVIWLISLAGETIADRQLARFRADPANRGRVCKTGLWRYSRHPNYFFEWVHWWAYVAIGWSGPHGWLTLFGPVVMLFFLLKVTGIPPTEAHALESRGDAYREYQQTTSVFFPWPPRRMPPKEAPRAGAGA